MSTFNVSAFVNSARADLGRVNLQTRRSLGKRLVEHSRREGSKAAQHDGVTVVTVTWNSLPFLKSLIQAVRMFGRDGMEILVIDNNSDDGTRQFLERQSDVRSVHAPLNIGHGLGLDLAFAKARTSHVVALDVDAFPISPQWLSTVLDPLAAGAIVAGAYVQRAFIHPSYLAMRRDDYYRLNLRFVPIGVPTPPGGIPRGLFMDVGEALSQTVTVVAGTRSLYKVPITATSGEDLVGSIYGDVVYHNFYSTQGRPDRVAEGRKAWEVAVAKYLSG